MKSKGLKLTLSGSYRTSNQEVVDFENLTGIIPFCDEDIAYQAAQRRYAKMWLTAARDEDGEKMYPARLDVLRECFMDDCEVIEHDFSFIGKDIREMTAEEIQDLAVAKDLKTVPLFKDGSLRSARAKAYVVYSEIVMGMGLDEEEVERELAKLPPLIVKDAKPIRDTRPKITNEEMISQEQKNTSTLAPRQTMSIDDLKAIAAEKGIVYAPNIGYDALYKKIYNG